MVPHRSTPLTILLVLSGLGLGLVAIIALAYGYDLRSRVAALIGLAILGAVLVALWLSSRRPASFTQVESFQKAAGYGIAIGLLWLVEICTNNLIAPPLPYRDWIDNVFWALVALCILILAAFRAYQANSIRSGMVTGVWSGFASGLVACWAALMMVVFGMRFILHDPLNIAEWSALRAGSPAPDMAAYFAFETLAGALLHLLVLGVLMGGLLGMVGSMGGKLARKIRRLQQP